MKLQILYQNKLNHPDYVAAIAEYSKRISAFAPIRLIPADAYQPGERDLYIEITSYGNTICSEELADHLKNYMMSGCQTVTFSMIPTEKPCYDRFCISGIKLSEPLSVTVLCEQIYRGFMILNNRTYHK